MGGYVPVFVCQVVRERSLKVDERTITRPADAEAILREQIGPADREHFVCLLLDSRSRVTGVHTVSIGSLNESLVHPREVFKAAIIAGAAAIIVGHNHPSGNPGPSPEDLAVSRKLVEAGKILGIPVLDSLILGDGPAVSLKERGDLS